MESSWRQNSFRIGWQNGPFDLVARINDGGPTDLWIADYGVDWIGYVLYGPPDVGILADLEDTEGRGEKHFPYGFTVFGDNDFT